MQKAYRRHYTSEHTRHRFQSDGRIQVSDRTVSKDQSDIEPDQGSAATENESHEAADRAVLLHPVAIVNPNQGQVLDVVKDFEQRDARQNICDAVVAVPPKRKARD